MKKFKNLFLALLLVFAVTMFVACDDPVDNTCTSHVDSNSDNKCDNCGTTIGGGQEDDDEEQYNFLGAKFYIQVDNLESSDPNSSKYTGLFKSEKAALIAAAEAKYNIDIQYINYPSSASWGGARERYIIENNVAGTPSAHILQIPSYSIGTLAVANAISPLSTYIEKYGNEGIWPESLEFSTVRGEVYGYSDLYSNATEGIFYNTGLYKSLLGEDAKTPAQMWLDGEWTWAKFREVCNQLDERVASDQYVLGGRAYNWAYQMLGANGIHIVDNNLQVGIDSEAGIATLTYMNELFNSVAWDYQSAALSNATSTEMVKGKVVFHNGQTYWINNKWIDSQYESIDFGYVPYPVGPNVIGDATSYDLDTDLEGYCINDVYGKAQYVISSAYSKDLVDPAYHNITLHDEVIFKIWSEIQYFPPIDPATGKASISTYVDEYVATNLDLLYADEDSIQAHVSVITLGYPDYFYSLDEAKGHVDGSYMLEIQKAVLGEVDDIRSTMTSLAQQIKAAFTQKYQLGSDYYN